MVCSGRGYVTIVNSVELGDPQARVGIELPGQLKILMDIMVDNGEI